MILIKGLETTIADARDKCDALWALITKGDEAIASRLMAAGDAKLAENTSKPPNA